MRSFIITFLAFISLSLSSQTFNVVPKIGSLEAGYRYIAFSTFPIHHGGPSGQLDLAWQVSGFNGKRAAYISVPLGFSAFNMVGSDTAANASILHYGFTIRHNLSYNKTAIPFVSYSLLLNQLWINGQIGHIIGHETRFDFGYDFHPENKRYTWLLKIEYSHMTFPSLGKKKSDMAEVFALKAGIRFH